MKELYIKGENVCKITKETCKKKTLCKSCKVAINYKKFEKHCKLNVKVIDNVTK